MTSAMGELHAISHDIRKVGYKKLPRNIERAAVIFSYGKSHRNYEASKECLQFGKLAKYIQCELYIFNDPTIDDFIDVMRHFLTQTKQVLLCFTVANRINGKSSSEQPEIPLVNGTVDPELLYDMLNSKKKESKLFFFMDGINKPEDWKPEKNGCNKEGIYVCAPYAVSDDATQFDTQQESFFASQLKKVVKAYPDESLENISVVLDEQINPFGLKTFVASYPAKLVGEQKCFI